MNTTKIERNIEWMSIKLNTRCMRITRSCHFCSSFFFSSSTMSMAKMEARHFVEFYILILVWLYIEFQIRSQSEYLSDATAITTKKRVRTFQIRWIISKEISFIDIFESRREKERERVKKKRTERDERRIREHTFKNENGNELGKWKQKSCWCFHSICPLCCTNEV